MVQGNSESPAIAQTFLLHVLSGAPSLRDKLLVYIDNVFLKSMSGNEQEHIEDIRVFVRVLAEANVTVNMRKSLWVATRGVEVLGRKWSANGDWKPFDHRVATLLSLPQPTTVSEIRRMNGSINAIAEHIPGS
ncbi:hypothetical protein GGH96_006343 [Coemansia sp. RSA 1972]|nr:hypothetical protein GGH96_006343 [Coemansia sp. RSA 1972]